MARNKADQHKKMHSSYASVHTRTYMPKLLANAKSVCLFYCFACFVLFRQQTLTSSKCTRLPHWPQDKLLAESAFNFTSCNRAMHCLTTTTIYTSHLDKILSTHRDVSIGHESKQGMRPVCAHVLLECSESEDIK